MERRLIFWVLMLIAFVFYLGLFAAPTYVGHYGGMGGALLNFILFLLLGWQVYGPPVRNG